MKYVLALMIAVVTGCASPGGIGVLYNKKGVVKHVFEKSPAEKAGLLLEDIISNTKELRGPIGSMCLVKYTRDGKHYQKLIERADVETFRVKDHGAWEHKK